MHHRYTGAAVYLLALTGCASDPPPPPPEPSPYANATVREGYHLASNDTVAVPAQRTFLVVDGTSAHGIAAPDEENPIQDLTEANLPEAAEEKAGRNAATPGSAPTPDVAPKGSEDGAAVPAARDIGSEKAASNVDAEFEEPRESDEGAGGSPTREAPAAKGVPAEITARQLRAWETYCDHPKGMTAEDWDIISRFDGIPDWVKDPGPGIEDPLRSKLRGCSDKAWR
ncbi:hypothetical protein SAMN05660831_00058 [Thiohalospira halophila DSM 15071]|uniref:Uncharacterized protein n=1 Tax=Thiohalospira halophila DSM 15071 TaxID=1123397 RepID=A0A1I1N0R6_9GAMM|nr:hypothetical protein [Thiohalospira halophila]SFC91241.1 hypothetical protein SAMN05660831_00058 [Thiohalospira halophila DSM 15071]